MTVTFCSVLLSGNLWDILYTSALNERMRHEHHFLNGTTARLESHVKAQQSGYLCCWSTGCSQTWQINDSSTSIKKSDPLFMSKAAGRGGHAENQTDLIPVGHCYGSFSRVHPGPGQHQPSVNLGSGQEEKKIHPANLRVWPVPRQAGNEEVIWKGNLMLTSNTRTGSYLNT